MLLLISIVKLCAQGIAISHRATLRKRPFTVWSKKCVSPQAIRSRLSHELSVTRFGQRATAKNAKTGNTRCRLKHYNVDRHTHDARGLETRTRTKKKKNTIAPERTSRRDFNDIIIQRVPQKPPEIPDFTAGSRKKNCAPREVATFCRISKREEITQTIRAFCPSSGGRTFSLPNILTRETILSRYDRICMTLIMPLERNTLYSSCAREFSEYFIEKATGGVDKVLSTTSDV